MKVRWGTGFGLVALVHAALFLSLMTFEQGTARGSSVVIFDLVTQGQEGQKPSVASEDSLAQKPEEKSEPQMPSVRDDPAPIVKPSPKIKAKKMQKNPPRVDQKPTDTPQGEGSLQNRLDKETVAGSSAAGERPVTEDTAVKARYAPKPDYPLSARTAGIEGEVKLRALVDINGRVQTVEVVRSSGFEVLDQSAKKALKKWRFVSSGGDAVRESKWCILTIKFQLKD